MFFTRDGIRFRMGASEGLSSLQFGLKIVQEPDCYRNTVDSAIRNENQP
jgi:hypothetical protein